MRQKSDLGSSFWGILQRYFSARQIGGVGRTGRQISKSFEQKHTGKNQHEYWARV
ncbi:hypothetical protein [Brumimicrobium aurantiacum]|uniref:hypothetical protein n=1 Tax=Brumimicrobium aurantiacum TaxID=1737063 RepID=UPI001401C924|nr:hypothetical protein [Brumimicrobium aurantiacum]